MDETRSDAEAVATARLSRKPRDRRIAVKVVAAGIGVVMLGFASCVYFDLAEPCSKDETFKGFGATGCERYDAYLQKHVAAMGNSRQYCKEVTVGTACGIFRTLDESWGMGGTRYYYLGNHLVSVVRMGDVGPGISNGLPLAYLCTDTETDDACGLAAKASHAR